MLLCLAIAAIYGPAAGGPFVFDDAASVVDNPSIRQLWPLVGTEERPGPGSPPADSPLATRPLVNYSFALNYYFGELEPFGYRTVNLALHCLAAILLWRIVARTLQSSVFAESTSKAAELLSFTTALVWAVHPLVTESVVYVTQRTELLMGVLYLATLYCSIRYWSAEGTFSRQAWLTLAIVSCVLGMLSKEMIASAPAVVLLYERTFHAGTFRRSLLRSWRLYLGLSISWLVAVVMHLQGSQTPNTGLGTGVSLTDWWLTQTQVIFLYLKLALWPWPLVIHYEIPHLTTLAEAWPWILGVAVYGAATVILLWRHPPTGSALTWVVAVLSPTLLIPLAGETAAERRMYLPLAALIALLVVAGHRGLVQLLDRRLGKPVTLLFCTCVFALAVGLGWLSSQRLLAFQDEVTLWQDALKHQPQNPVVRANLGCCLAEAEEYQEAITHLREWIRLQPDSHRGHFNLALSLEKTNEELAAIEHYRKSLELHPAQAATHYNLARLLEGQGDWPSAILHYRKAIEIQSDFSAAHTNLGLLLLELGKSSQAIDHLAATLPARDRFKTGESQSLAPYENLMLAYLQAGRREEALQTAQEAAELARTKNDQEAAEQFEADIATIRAMRE